MFKQKIIDKFLKQAENIEYGSLTITTADGKIYNFKGKHEFVEADIKINNPSTITNLIAKGDVGFAESYRDGEFETDNLPNLLMLALKNQEAFKDYLYGSKLSSFFARLFYFFKRNSISGSKRNIHHHYDLGNEFYSIWLDQSMTYSSAIFEQNSNCLKTAQEKKYDRIIEKLGGNSSNLLEIGCGWGGFAERAVKTSNFDIKGITISDQQFSYAQNRLGDLVNISKEDYRLQQGKYKNIVSIEMFEAVGEKYWNTYFSKVKSLLDNKGKAVIQTITIDEPYFQEYRKTGDMIRSFIFPGGMLPSISRFDYEASKVGLKVNEVFKFGQDYATTLRYWLKSFEDNIQKIKGLKFDEPFIRIWKFYLSVCIASFSVGRTNVIQAEISHA